MKLSLQQCMVFVGSIGLAIPALADQGNVQLGWVVSANTSYYQDVGDEFHQLPLIIAEYDQFYWQAVRGGYRFFNGENHQVAVEVRRTFDGYESDDSSALAGMARRYGAWEAGVAHEFGLLGGQLTTQIMQDVSVKHQGTSVRVNYERPLLIKPTYLVTWYTGAEHWDRDKTHYYFGVRPGEATAARPAYRADSSHILIAGCNAVKQLSPRLLLLVSTEYQTFSGTVKESPLTERHDEWAAHGGIFYQF
ncbi:Outer membrane scaffolding protein for murein synthesis, MipA/OmpV family [Ectothiorhodospira marina]|uniref:Outer membrane scaffolding protein for murein synthesis, MipA/OmpV family n=2 Tax=Ectothiorhodospira marina TaxID=1396821 RepID=A0A1H7PT85_9GAMM|nr:Outer membrane scaffolding protein for murein synthesis, MipA/OmpV family [Ectothiorhodospira marina]